MNDQITVTMPIEQVRVVIRLIEMAQESFPQDLIDAGIYTDSNRAFVALATAIMGGKKCTAS